MSNTKKILLLLIAILLIGTTLLVLAIRKRVHPKNQPVAEETAAAETAAEDTSSSPDSPATPNDIPLQRQQLSFLYNTQNIPLAGNEEAIACTQDTQKYVSASCVRYTYQDNSSSEILFDQDVLRERTDFLPDHSIKRWTSWSPENYSLAEWKIYSANGEERHSIYNLDGTLTNYSLRQDKRLLLGVMYFALLKDPKFFEIPTSFMISETEKTALVYILVPTALKTDNIIQYTKRRITLPDTDSLIDKVLGQIDDQNQIVLADGQKIPLRSSFKKAPSYCTLYPYDCIKP